MSAELGVGVRVWVGWTSQDKCLPGPAPDGRLQSGTITSGPFKPGETIHGASTGATYELHTTCWNVGLDRGDEIFASEDMLFPIDDGEAETREREDEVEA